MTTDELISEIMKNINSGNRWACDYLIVDEIERLIGEYEKSGGCEKCNDHSQPERLNVHESQKDADCISRQAAIDGLDGHYVERINLNEWQAGWNNALEWVQGTYLDDLPSVQPERKPGRWTFNPELYPGGDIKGHYECDQCGAWVREKTKYCPDCGSYNGGEK